MGNASWPVQTLRTSHKGRWRTRIDKHPQVHRCKKSLIHSYLRNINSFHGNPVAHPPLNPEGLVMTFWRPQNIWNKHTKICLDLRTLSLILHNINKEIRVLHSGRRADLLFWGGKEAGGWQRVPPKSMAFTEIIPLGLNENTHCLSDPLQRKFGNLCFGA